MDAKEITNFLHDNYSNTKDTLKNISFDSANNEYLCDSLEEAFSYDAIIKLIYPHQNHPKTPDAIFVGDNISFIEFKNGNLKNNKKEISLELKLKALEGLYSFSKHFIAKQPTNDDLCISYIVVYNEQKNPSSRSKNLIKEHVLEKKTQEKYIRFGLERLEGTYFDKVFTLSKEEFEEEFLKKAI